MHEDITKGRIDGKHSPVGTTTLTDLGVPAERWEKVSLRHANEVATFNMGSGT